MEFIIDSLCFKQDWNHVVDYQKGHLIWLWAYEDLAC